MNQAKHTFLALAVIIFGFAAIYGLSNFNEHARPALPDGYANEDLSIQGGKLKGFALGAEGLIADWYWMNSLQYMGDKIHDFEGDINLDNLKPLNPRLLYPYLDNAATLDPQFTSIYEYGANILPAIDTEKAILLTQKGIGENPDNWRLYHYLGYIRWKMRDYEKSAESYERGAAVKGRTELDENDERENEVRRRQPRNIARHLQADVQRSAGRANQRKRRAQAFAAAIARRARRDCFRFAKIQRKK
jgi:tetratricopeptide (TPR) repeat protein